MLLLASTMVQAQIKIGGNVYGGGNAGTTGGKTSVTIHAGDLKNVYGGARQADIGGSAHVNIDGEHISGDILIDAVYGGNDISGTIGTSADIPTGLVNAGENGIDNTYNAFVQTTPERQETTGTGDDAVTSQPYGIFVGQLFGGGNGDYTYTADGEGTYTVKDGDTEIATKANKPELAKTYLELRGGTVAFVYGGGNNATVTQNTDICIDNDRLVTTSIPAGAGNDAATNKLLDMERLTAMGIPMLEGVIMRDVYHFSRVFGGNNKAVMTIQPKWHLLKGHIENLYSGGNEGAMTNDKGLLLEIPATSTVLVDNVYGGCRKADVSPMAGEEHVTATNLEGYSFPEGLSARVIIRGGDINNVYGGNDVSGKVWGGAAVGVYHSIRGDIYGGGNGSYPYTDNINLKNTLAYGDFCYAPYTGTSVEALNLFRPTTESVSIFVKGTDAEHPTIIGGSIYCGGNSTTLRNDDPTHDPYSELKVGSHVIADNVFLGNNGVNLTSDAVLEQLAGNVTVNGTEYDFSQIDLLQPDQMNTYMDAVAMDIKPRVVFSDYEDYTTKFGSLFGGGNVGSITYNGSNELRFSEKIIIYEKVVGGCNNAFVPAGTHNAAYQGGVTGMPDATTGNKLVMNFEGLKIQPMRWSDASKTSLIWDTKKWQTSEDAPAQLVDAVVGDGTQTEDLRLDGGNVYGGCYRSGYVNGNVVINIKSDLVDKDVVFGDTGSGVDRVIQYNDVMATTLNVFGAGYGEQSEIKGNTTINIENGYVFQTFGGGEKGTVTGNCTTNLKGGQVEYIYGGGLEGPITESVVTRLGAGTCAGVIGGSCNANIGGHTEVYIGDQDLGSPKVTEDIYGGNDFGGEIADEGRHDFSDRVSDFARGKVYNDNSLTASAYVEYIQGEIGGSIYGGNYGSYDYTNPLYRKYTKADGSEQALFSKPRLKNSFVNFKPNNAGSNDVANVYGGSQGYAQEAFNNRMQDRSYVLVDIQNTTITNFADTQFFGAGDYAGVGLFADKATAEANTEGIVAAAVIDLVRGQIKAAYGGSYQEGTTRRTIVNVPVGSQITVENIFAGAYGVRNDRPCDVYEATLNYRSGDATVTGALYGGNNNARRTMYGTVNVYSPVWSDKVKGFTATVYGAGYGENSWSRNTTINLENGANVYEVYGGGNAGMVLNVESAAAWKTNGGNSTLYTDLDGDYTSEYLEEKYARTNPLGKKTDTNVYIKEGATVSGYAYGGGLGATATIGGSTYVGLHGGKVVKDLFAGGTSGAVEDKFGVGLYDENNNPGGFIAETYAYVEGGTARNVYGGGWKGSVGYHEGLISDSKDNDIDGAAHVVIGKVNGTSITDGIPAILRNVYGGGEGGSVYGKADVTMNNGYIGYNYDGTGSDDAETKRFDERYVEVLDDKDPNDLDPAGNIFGGGYVANSFTDFSEITMWGGTVRGCLYGGGEIGPIGRGTTKSGASEENTVMIHENYKPGEKCVIYKGGSTKVVMYSGHVMRDVFGGGRGFDNWGGDGTMFMDADVKATLDLSLKGYVFGSTEVRIRGGEVGTVSNASQGYGNVFGGGNVGFVFSAEGKKEGNRGSQAISELSKGLPVSGGGYYYKTWHEAEADRDQCELSLDCNVVVEPYCQVKEGKSITIDNTYNEGEYVPIEELNKLGDKETDKTQWDNIDWETGVTIHNAVFAGGNVIMGSDQMFVNTATVYGNVTAAMRDAYHNDLITVGTEHIGGLYGDGNLTFVDGWRELHIDNYGTDYYNMDQEVTKERYLQMSDRERAYFVLNYRYKGSETNVSGEINGTNKTIHLQPNDRFTSDKFKETFFYDYYSNSSYPAAFKEYINSDGTPNPAYFEELGFCSIYAGRLLNTIQRCDMAAIWGSRIVLQGARDRVPEKADFTRYTINRVGELSLNQRKSEVQNEVEDSKVHGNYFGIYNVVNYLGNLTSDVFFTELASSDPDDPSHTAIRKTSTSNTDNMADGSTTYYQWKTERAQKPNRNNGTSANKVSLASGVYLEIIREESEKAGHTEWGLITGVIELDLIDVKTGQGGGYVYARNQHGAKTWHSDWKKVNLSPYNLTARTYKRFTYDETESSLKEIETSGNFVHSRSQIIDDCYPNSNAYKGPDASPAHFWYIKGSIYVYDQYISAFTGAATAYHQTVSIPLTISASTHGKLTLRDVQPNLYAYYNDEHQPLGGNSVLVGEITYKAGDPIDYWTYQMLSESDREHFVPDIYNTIAECTITKDEVITTYPAGTVLLPTDYNTLKSAAPKKNLDDDDTDDEVPYVHLTGRDEDVAFDYVFRRANVISHDEGFVLTLDMNNPATWDDYYTKNDGNTSIPKEKYDEKDNDGNYTVANRSDYTEGPTYKPINSGVYGQKSYKSGDIITKDVYDSYVAIKQYLNDGQRGKQADAKQAWVVTQEMTVGSQLLTVGSPVYKDNYTDEQWTSMSGKVALAKVCTSTLKYSDEGYVYAGDLLSDDDITRLGLTSEQQANHMADAYMIISDGLYGGSHFVAGNAYSALSSWCSMSKTDRANFRYNYDGMDLLIDNTYGGIYGFKPQYDGYMPGTTKTVIEDGISQPEPQYPGCTPLSPIRYSETQKIDFEAEFNPTPEQKETLGNHYNDDSKTLTYNYTDQNNQTQITIGERIKRTAYEKIPNERVHWSPIIVDHAGDYYVVKEAFVRGDMPYTVGQVIDESVYNALTETQKENNIDAIRFEAEHVGATPKHYYFCREPYTIGEKGEGYGGWQNLGITDDKQTFNEGDEVKKHLLIDEETYKQMPNLQAGFQIHGTAPQEASTFYVSREPDIYDLQKEKIITVIYMYEYEESDESGNNITPVSERHVLNIHINFESGIPEIGPLSKPNIVLPGTTVGLKIPNVEPGAFEVTGSGWEIFENEQDAINHRNGKAYKNNETPMYWYQNGYYVAYYAQSYLGKTYSNAVPFSVANYHDLKKVMDDKEHHYYIDHEDVDRASKIYINDYSASSENGLDLFKSLYDLSVLANPTVNAETGLITTGTFIGHAPLNNRVSAGINLEFFLRTDIDHPAGWTSIGSGSDPCFEGTFHGDGHTISGLETSLFDKLCGSVYNLGVTGSFTEAGVANTGDGYVENCWVKSSASSGFTGKAVFGNPSAGDGVQLVNCYYPESNAYSTSSHSRGNAIKKPDAAFYNGEVAYNLNGFYLNKRYYDGKAQTTGSPYQFWKANADGTLAEEVSTGHYPESPDAQYGDIGYVERRFSNPDFLYAGGSIPEEDDKRLLGDATSYAPIWPDDYLYFGQMLTYGYSTQQPHQELPSAIFKSGNRLMLSNQSNRVYRAPAYYQSATMGVAHFNSWANLAAKSKDGTQVAYPGMTAIDFTGYKDVSEGYVQGKQIRGFYPPLLDNDGLTGIANRDLTKNLLIYIPEEATGANGMTRSVVLDYATDPEYSNYYDADNKYKTVSKNMVEVNTHVVERVEAGSEQYQSVFDHFLVDKQDFNAPISYTFTNGNRMWYQRTPDRYVDLTRGWETVSLPFTAELVTTQDKGEITHFYSGSPSIDGNTKTGHEYWLREYIGEKSVDGDILTATFNYPTASGSDKEVTNTFLWDYYYSKNERKDLNTDQYQTYYEGTRTYESYALLAKATPYIIGFPGKTYYEFDLSGQWEPKNTAEVAPAKLDQQVITFASAENTTIGVSDDEMTEVAHDGYSFVPNYLNESIAAGEGYLMNSEGSRFDKTTTPTATVPFRPYFTTAASGSRQAARAILFDGEGSSFAIGDDRDPSEGDVTGGLTFFTKRHQIGVTSTLREAADVQIYNMSGQSVTSFTILPGETVERDIPIAAVYIVRAAHGRYTKKIAVK